MLGNMDLYHLRFHLIPQSAGTRGFFWGDHIRGSLGNEMRRLVCIDLNSDCRSCALDGRCLYTRFFDIGNPSSKDASSAQPTTAYMVSKTNNRLSTRGKIPRPFVLHRVSDDLAEIEIILIGDHKAEFVPYLIHCFRQMGRYGIGPKGARSCFSLKRAAALDLNAQPVTVYEEGTIVLNGAPVIDMKAIEETVLSDRAIGQIKLHFLSPLRIKAQDNGGRSRLIKRPSFQMVIDRLAFRADLLHVYHCGGETDYDHRALVQAAGDVLMADPSPLYWQARSRYSRSQNKRMNLDGFMGEARFAGPNLERFLPLLKLGEYIHVGKNTTFGHGAIRVETEK